MASINRYKTDQGEKKWVARITLKGFKRLGKSFDSKRDAEEWAARIEAELKAQRSRGGTRAEVGTLTLLQLIEAFLADANVKQLKWYDDLEQMLATWADEYGGTRVRSFGRLQKAAFRDKLLGQEYSNARVNRYLAALRRVWTWGLENGYILPSAPWPPGLFLKEPPPKEVIATNEEVAAIFTACDKVDSTLGSLARFLVGTGSRLSDALSVTWRDVDQKAGDVAIRGQKTSRPLRVAMLAPAKEAIRRASKVKHIGRAVFWQYKHRMAPRSHWERAKKEFPEHLRTMRLHDCRHLCASLLAANGATDVELAAQLGHATLQMVKRYSHLRGGHRGAAHDKLDKALGGG
ncbi:MAG TPA: tyrosine-type recombinase/integrase [Steroidobacteraceae bacterium]|nr:tyrosine-type recombinase/integrase [Steroidobacteraceae bacterium]